MKPKIKGYPTARSVLSISYFSLGLLFWSTKCVRRMFEPVPRAVDF